MKIILQQMYSSVTNESLSHLLVVKSTAAAGGVAVFGEAVGQIPVQHIRHGPRDAFPGQNDDDDDGVGTVMAGALAYQAQQLLRLAASTDHLTGSKAQGYFSFSPSREVPQTPQLD